MKEFGLRRILKYLANIVIFVYIMVTIFYIAHGPVSFSFLGAQIRLENLFKPFQILLAALLLRGAFSLAWNKKTLFDAIILSISTIMALAMLEGYFRIRYPEEMIPLRYVFNDAVQNGENERGPYYSGPPGPEVTRIMVQGDSVTWGIGVTDWKDLYPNTLLGILNKGGHKYDMQVWAVPGMQVDFHAKMLAHVGAEVEPDIIVYQWYVNDVEIWAGRPDQSPDLAAWRKNRVQILLSSRSLFFRFVDSRLCALFFEDGPKYARYLQENIIPGKKYWWFFELEFHKWATYANSLAQRTIMMTFPSLPYSGEYPFAKVTDSVVALTRPHLMKIPVAYLFKRVGTEERGHGGVYEESRVVRVGSVGLGHLAFGPYMVMPGGDHLAVFNMKLLAPVQPRAKVALLEVACQEGKKILGSRMITGADMVHLDAWEQFTIPFTVEEPMSPDVEFRIEWFGEADLAMDTIDVPVDYNIEVVNPMDRLKTFNTHAGLFEAHPGVRAHHEMARLLAEKIMEKPTGDRVGPGTALAK
ncbi:MAG: hypothetical protein OEZ32_02845 [Nitrospinota bacterium]|nr:hypothetical protein [Nitrospinota bacterium]